MKLKVRYKFMQHIFEYNTTFSNSYEIRIDPMLGANGTSIQLQMQPINMLMQYICLPNVLTTMTLFSKVQKDIVKIG